MTDRPYSKEYGTQGGVFSRDKTHCLNDHEFDEANTLWVKRKSRNPRLPDRWSRQCRKCADKQRADYKARQEIMRLWAEVQTEMRSEVEKGAMSEVPEFDHIQKPKH